MDHGVGSGAGVGAGAGAGAGAGWMASQKSDRLPPKSESS